MHHKHPEAIWTMGIKQSSGDRGPRTEQTVGYEFPAQPVTREIHREPKVT